MNCTMIAAVSTDGYIAASDGDTSWLSNEDRKLLLDEIAKHDVLIMGRRTYDTVKDNFVPGVFKQRIVLTKTPTYLHDENVTFVNIGFEDIIKNLRSQGKSIIILGGSSLYTRAVNEKIANRIVITTEPVELGGGISLFEGDVSLEHITHRYKHVATATLNNTGTVVDYYEK